ncbi:unnamed protein product [Amoebophrya sp. A25]|nr:unnamed protein product [Amoebophrya sp. A25]CAD7977203.1 unnamed protein product [Amoebophrya sp. A25]|eukprot:GSA25T00026408001.1
MATAYDATNLDEKFLQSLTCTWVHSVLLLVLNIDAIAVIGTGAKSYTCTVAESSSNRALV